jgi:hypothetical protein
VNEIAEPAERVNIARLVSGNRQVSDTPASFKSGLFKRHPSLHVLVDTFIEMKLRFLGEVVVEIRT